MVTPMLRELAGPFPMRPLFERSWYVHERTARELTEAWADACSQAVQNGSAEELHAARDNYQGILLGYLKILDGYLMLLNHVPEESPEAEFTNSIKRTRVAVQKHYDALFPRWQTIDDLEALLLERVSPSNEQLKTLAAGHRPPQAWFDEDHNALTTPE
ncbi:hypothetical protein R5W24_001807 [Gemmata sp. JC717]|uniref:hypothetical protein n=1 Tax=Gemmata algarum TaxID=2975278 RepID=UPI0021BB5E2D|nr:hypothetical protein [Gemmata algarum]MDY3552719.1 hypothetical protein [Gemmata algarum]